MNNEKSPTTNSTYKKLAVQWLNEAVVLRFKFCGGRQFCTSKSPTSCSFKTLAAIPKTNDQKDGFIQRILPDNRICFRVDWRREVDLSTRCSDHESNWHVSKWIHGKPRCSTYAGYVG